MKKRSGRKIILIMGLCTSLIACSTGENGDQEQQLEIQTQETTGEKQLSWAYAGDTGVEHWAELDTAFKACGKGKEQSPINLDEGLVKKTSTPQITLEYQASAFTIRNNGHTIQADAVHSDNLISLDGKEYTLVQFHFHLPSEHEINGEAFDMELHLVHQNEEEQLAVLGVLIKAGMENLALEELWAKLPQEETKDSVPLKQAVELTSMLPQDSKAFHYYGSLTTPPCTEGVKWAVLAEPIELSQEQIDVFSSIFPDNHRPRQEWNHREVFEVFLGR